MKEIFELSDLAGVWQRRSIEKDGQKDMTTQVIWLQTPKCFGDIRIPIDRPKFSSDTSWAELTESDALALSKQQGFAGVTQLEGSLCQWHRYLDYQPFNGLRDIGSLHWEQDILIELGIDSIYKEEWQRLDDGSGDFTALVLSTQQSLESDSSWQGCLVTAGDYFIYALNRSSPLPASESLTSLLLNSRQDPSQQLRYLDCEISFGRCKLGHIPWQIERSTLPWREEQSLWSLSDLDLDLDNGQVIQTVNHSTEKQTRHWKVWEWGTALLQKT
jgi:hypothetical protein